MNENKKIKSKKLQKNAELKIENSESISKGFISANRLTIAKSYWQPGLLNPHIHSPLGL